MIQFNPNLILILMPKCCLCNKMIKNQQIKLIHEQIPINLHCILRYKMIKWQHIRSIAIHLQFMLRNDQITTLLWLMQYMSNACHKMVKYQHVHDQSNHFAIHVTKRSNHNTFISNQTILQFMSQNGQITTRS